MSVWYRYEHSRTEGGVRLYRFEYVKIKETLKGVWLRSAYGGAEKHFVLDNSRKKFAWPTKRDALVSFIARKKRQIEILTYQLESANLALQAAKAMQQENET